MAVTDPLDLLARAAAPRDASLRLVTGRWDGQYFRPSSAPDATLAADLACDPPAANSFVYAVIDSGGIVIIGPPGRASYGTTGRGSWWRSPDGMQICWIHTTAIRAATAEYGTLHQSRWEWGYPIPFVATPSVTCSQWQWSTGASWGTVSGDASTHSALLRGIDVVPRSVADDLTISATAIGRWRN